MNLAIQKIKVYTRIGLAAGAVLAVALVFFNNRNNQAPVWFFWLTDPEKPVNVVWLMICTAAAAVACWWIFVKSWSLWRDWHELKQARTVAELKRKLDERAASLDDQQRRIDDKVGKALESDAPDPADLEMDEPEDQPDEDDEGPGKT